MSAAMLRRADEVRHQRQYLGFFEWVVWAVLRNVSVHMLFGSEVVDVGLLFGPSIAPAAGDIRGTHRVVACRVTGVGGLLSAVGPRSLKPEVNHFVIGVPLLTSGATHAALVVPGSLKQAVQVQESAAAAAQRAGWGLKLTVADGDCGVDTMSYFDNAGRTLEKWTSLRNEIADKIAEVAGQSPWQEVFRCCCEEEDKDIEGVFCDGGRGACLI